MRYLFSRTLNGKSAARVAIYGAGDAGARLSSVLLGGPDFEPVAFIDDKKSLQGSSINGLTVFGLDVLPQLVRAAADRADSAGDAVGFPAPAPRDPDRLEPLGLHVQSLPHLTDLIAGKARIDELRDVDVGDLLGRDPVPPNPRLFGSCIRNKCVLVTGRRRLHRLRAVPPDHAALAQPPGAVRDVGNRSLHH